MAPNNLLNNSGPRRHRRKKYSKTDKRVTKDKRG